MTRQWRESQRRLQWDLLASRAATAVIVALPTAAAFGPLAGVGSVFAYRVMIPVLAVLALVARRPLCWDDARSVASVARIQWVLIGLAVLFVAAAIGSTVTSSVAKDWSELVAVLLTLVLAWSLVRLGPGRLVVWCRGWLPAFVVMAVIAVWEIVTSRHLPNYLRGLAPPGHLYREPAATFVNPNLFAVFLLGVIGFGALGARIDTSRTWRIAHVVMAVAAVGLLWTTGSVLACASLLTGGIAVGLSARRWRRWVLFGLGVAVIAGVAALVGPMRDATHRWLDTFHMALIGHRLAGLNTLALRFSQLVNAADATLRYPLTGMGPGSFESYVATKPLIWMYGLYNAHDGLGEVAAQYGAVVALVVVAGLVTLFVWGVRALRGAFGRRRALAVGLVAGIAGFGFMSMCNSIFLEPAVIGLLTASVPMLAASLACEYREETR